MQNFILKDNGVEARGDSVDPRELQAREPCFFHIQSLSQIQKHADLIRFAISKTRMVVISMPVKASFEPGFLEQIRSLNGLYAISVRYRLNPSADSTHAGSPMPGMEGDLRVVSHYQQLLDNFHFSDRETLTVIPEIEITDELQLLGPTLMAFAKRRPPWIVLAVDSLPTKERIATLKNCFEYLQIRSFPLIDIHFSFEYENSRHWKVQSECFYSGPEEFHIDLSNKCTHSCVFCALYAPAILEDLKATNRLDENMRKFMSAQLNEQKALDLIQSLPITTRLVQFGGAGDPMLHPKAIELITLLRERGIAVEVLSNMEYFKDGDHEKLTQLGGKLDCSIKYIVNLSGATAETYVRTRPRQTEVVFKKIISTLKKFSQLRENNNGLGVHFAIMCVLNRLNYHEAPLLVDLAREVHAAQLWFKPLEVHSRLHYPLLPTADEHESYALSLRQALEKADKAGVKILDRNFLEETIQKSIPVS